MQPTQKLRVKICCNSSMFEAQLAFQFATSVFGLVCAKPGGPGIISKDLITQIAATHVDGILLDSSNRSLAIKKL